MLTPHLARVAPLGLLLAAATVAPTGAHDQFPAAAAPHIGAILQARCAPCHVRGGPAPMPLTTGDEIRRWAQSIKEQVLTRRMPKWAAAHGYGAFANDPSLTTAEMTALAALAGGVHPVDPLFIGSQRSPRPVPLARRATALSIRASATDTTLRTASRWIGGWDFEPGDPLITAVTFTSADGTPIGTWTAGDAPVRLDANAAVHLVAPIRIRIQRRTAAAAEQRSPATRSVLRLLPRTAAPKRRVWSERMACGAARSGPTADLLAVRPLLADGAAARVWLERPGSPRTIVGWFRDFETLYPRVYWLARPIDLPPESRIVADVPCTMELTLSARTGGS